MRYIIPAPTTLTLPFVVPSSYTCDDVEAMVNRVAGESFEDVKTDDVCCSCSCTQTITLQVTFKRITPQAMRKVMMDIYATAAKELGARQPTPVSVSATSLFNNLGGPL